MKDKHSEMLKRTKELYDNRDPWNDGDPSQDYVKTTSKNQVQKCLDKYINKSHTVLNAGSGKTTYKTDAKVIYMDIIEDYIKQFDNYIVGNIEAIPLENGSVDAIICVGSVLNYVNPQKVLAEFSRVLKEGGYVFMEFERTESVYYKWTPAYKKNKLWMEWRYHGTDEVHLCCLYNEKTLLSIAEFNDLQKVSSYRYYYFPTFITRYFKLDDQKASKYANVDEFLRHFSMLNGAHYVFLTLKKITDESSVVGEW